MNFQQRYEYNRRTMSEAAALYHAVGRHRSTAALSLTQSWQHNLACDALPMAHFDRYDHTTDLHARRTLAADLAAIRYGVSTREQRQRVARTPVVPRAAVTSRPHPSLRAHALNARTMVAILNKIAGERMFCSTLQLNLTKRAATDAGIALAEDMIELYDGGMTLRQYAATSSLFPDKWFRIHDETTTLAITGFERTRMLTTRAPRKLLEEVGAVPLVAHLRSQYEEAHVNQLLQRLDTTSNGMNIAMAWIMPEVLERHAQKFTMDKVREKYGRAMTEYHSSAAYLRGHAERDDVTLGLEWEIGVPGARRSLTINRVLNTFSKAAGTLDYIHAERDGTLRGRGAEFVFAYRSLDKHCAVINDAFDSDAAQPLRHRTLPKLQNLLSAGIHVHIGRARPSGQEHGMEVFGRMHNLLNTVGNRQFMYALAGRGHGHYTRYDDEVFGPGDDNDDIHIKLGSSRYRVLNLRSSTVELRMFRSDPSREWLLMTLEFADALLKYCLNDHGMSMYNHMNARNFVRWVMACEDCYPNLRNRLLEPSLVIALNMVPVVKATTDEEAEASTLLMTDAEMLAALAA